MKKVELLAPAGSWEALVAAVSSGADAVYLGGTRFGARAFASNFDDEKMLEAVRYCHIRNVKVYVTVNTLVYEDELEEAKQYIDFLYHAQVDALIVQDLGIFELVQENYPDFELHCSTQMHIHNLDGVALMKKRGAARVVLARETPLDLIRQCTKLKIETEVFVHGALCICYSGQCLFSSLNGGRSGNRGECAQPCRMKYDLINLDTHQKVKTTGQYLLSTQDLYTLDHVEELIEAGITSFKIEGRMKRAEYVAKTVECYRQAIDAYYQAKDFDLKKANYELKKLFNRGFTEGHLFNQTGHLLMNTIRPNHQGVALGKVIKNEKGKVTIELQEDLHQGDGIRIISSKNDEGLMCNRIVKNGLLVNEAYKHDMIELEVSKKLYCKKNNPVLITTDKKQCEQILAEIKSYYKKFPLKARFYAHLNQPIELCITDGIHEVKVYSQEKCSLAKNQPISQETILRQLNKINDTIYHFEAIEIDCDENLFIGLKTINEIRREAITKMDDARSKLNRRQQAVCHDEFSEYTAFNHSVLIEVNHAHQAEMMQGKGILFSQDLALCTKKDIHIKGIRSIEQKQKIDDEIMLHSQLGTLNNPKIGTWIADASFNVCNSYALRFLRKCGIDAVVASQEASDEAIEKMIEGYKKRYHHYPNVGKFTYGRKELMIMKHCILNTALSDGKRVGCSLCRNHQYALVNEKGNQFLLTRDPLCHSVILTENIYKDFTLPKNIAFQMLHCTTEENIKEIENNETIY